VISVLIIVSAAFVIFQDQELTLRRMSYVAEDLLEEKKLTLVLDDLPDSVIIADQRSI